MKKNLLLIFFIYNVSFAQNPYIKQWDKRYGGTEPDLITTLLLTSDGGFMAGGFSFSDSSGDKTQNNWGGTTYADFWLVKTNDLCQKQWDKYYGGTGTDTPSEIITTIDGGYMMLGSSNSGINGDKTQPAWGTSTDYWIVKIDSAGNKLWDKRYGGTDNDYAAKIVQLADGGYVIAGTSYSGIGGNKTQASWGSSDYWVVRIDAAGNLIWDKRFGGTDSENLQAFLLTADGNYLMGGTSRSGISGDRTENSRGFDDYWIVKIDTSGSKIWDKRYGGNQSDELMNLLETPDGGYLLGGNSSSSISPDKSQNPFGNYDFWVLKINGSGVKLWDKIYGGSDKEEQEGTLIQTSDGHYVISGSSYSPVSGNKTEANLGFEQAWLLKFDSLGNVISDKTIFTIDHDEQSKLVESADGCLVLAIQSGALVGGYKTEPSWGGFYFDYWMIKMCDTTMTTSLPVFSNNVNALIVSPDPSAHFIQLSFGNSNNNFEIEVINFAGSLVLKTKNEKIIDVSGLAKGIYFIKVIDSKRFYTAKIIKE
jgi:type IX secretion system substrate protein